MEPPLQPISKDVPRRVIWEEAAYVERRPLVANTAHLFAQVRNLPDKSCRAAPISTMTPLPGSSGVRWY